MAIITRDEVKTILQITGSDFDTLIDTFLPMVEAAFIKIRGIGFFEFEANLTNGSPDIEIIDNFDYKLIKKQDVIESRPDDGTNLRGRVLYINYEDAIVTLDSNSNITEIDYELIIYPGNARFILSKMIDYNMQKDNANGYKSERFGSYNYTKFDSMSGYPVDITQMIQQYQPGHL